MSSFMFEVEIFEPISWRRLWGWTIERIHFFWLIPMLIHSGTGSCIPPLRLRTAAARHESWYWMFFSSLFEWLASGKASELRVYMSRLFPDAVESLCQVRIELIRSLMVLLTCTQLLICNAQFFSQRKHCQAKPAPRDARLLRSDFSSCLYLVIWLQHGGVQLWDRFDILN